MLGSDVFQSNVINKATRRFHFCDGNLDASTNAKYIQEYVPKLIEKINSVDKIEIKSKMFKVRVDDNYGSLILNPNNYPNELGVKRFFFLRPRQIQM